MSSPLIYKQQVLGKYTTKVNDFSKPGKDSALNSTLNTLYNEQLKTFIENQEYEKPSIESSILNDLARNPTLLNPFFKFFDALINVRVNAQGLTADNQSRLEIFTDIILDAFKNVAAKIKTLEKPTLEGFTNYITTTCTQQSKYILSSLHASDKPEAEAANTAPELGETVLAASRARGADLDNIVLLGTTQRTQLGDVTGSLSAFHPKGGLRDKAVNVERHYASVESALRTPEARKRQLNLLIDCLNNYNEDRLKQSAIYYVAHLLGNLLSLQIYQEQLELFTGDGRWTTESLQERLRTFTQAVQEIFIKAMEATNTSTRKLACEILKGNEFDFTSREILLEKMQELGRGTKPSPPPIRMRRF